MADLTNNLPTGTGNFETTYNIEGQGGGLNLDLDDTLSSIIGIAMGEEFIINKPASQTVSPFTSISMAYGVNSLTMVLGDWPNLPPEYTGASLLNVNGTFTLPANSTVATGQTVIRTLAQINNVGFTLKSFGSTAMQYPVYLQSTMQPSTNFTMYVVNGNISINCISPITSSAAAATYYVNFNTMVQ